MIYLDNNGTTGVLLEVLEAMMPYFTTDWGNPSSSYKFGSKLKTVIEMVMDQRALGLVFTGLGVLVGVGIAMSSFSIVMASR